MLSFRAFRQKVRFAKALGVFTAVLIIWMFFTLHQSWKWTPTRRADSQPQENHEDELSALRRFSEKLSEISIRVILVEPSILFDILPEPQQEILLRNGFSETKMTPDVISVAIKGRQDVRLNLPSVNFRLESSGFVLVAKETVNQSSFSKHLSRKLKGSPLITHFMYLYRDLAIHVVVFYAKDHYIWHGKWDKVPTGIQRHVLQGRKLHFSESDAVYDRFTAVPCPRNGSLNGLYVPGNTEHFLFQTLTSKMISCHSKRNISNGIKMQLPTSAGMVPKEIFEKTAASLIKEMKLIMEPLMKPFWLASGTLLGWYRDCDILPYTSDVDLAAWAKDIDLENIFREKQSVIVFRSALGQPKRDLELWLTYRWLNVDLFFTYQNDYDFWVGGHNPRHGYSFRYLFPRFSLCSGVFLGFKVNVPCETDAMLEAEYGPGWRTPVIDWNYEISARNVLGRRYWNSEEKRDFAKGK